MSFSDCLKQVKIQLDPWLLRNFTQDYRPEFYQPYRHDDCRIFLGHYTGVVAFPAPNDGIFFAQICEDDGHYWVAERATFFHGDDIADLMKCYDAAMKYVSEWATPMYYGKGKKKENKMISTKLPWRDRYHLKEYERFPQ